MSSHTAALVAGDGIGSETSVVTQRVVKVGGVDIVWDAVEAGRIS